MNYLHICGFCGTRFQTDRKSSKYCTISCGLRDRARKKGHAPRGDTCKFCGNPLKDLKRKTCDWACERALRSLNAKKPRARLEKGVTCRKAPGIVFDKYGHLHKLVPVVADFPLPNLPQFQPFSQGEMPYAG